MTQAPIPMTQRKRATLPTSTMIPFVFMIPLKICGRPMHDFRLTGAGDRDRTGTGLVSPRDLKHDHDSETIESYLHEPEEYHNAWESED